VQSWCDHDGDGWQDLYYLNGHSIDVLRNRGGGPFERLPGASVGLTLPESDPASTRQFNFASLRHVDFDSDGDLDLWVLMFGEEWTNHVFVREGERFSRASERLGLGAIRGNIFAVLADLDGDGFEDAVSGGSLNGEIQNAVLWRNRGGKRFDFSPLTAVPKPVHIGTNLDLDADGRWDIACMGTERFLLRNTGTSGAFVDVALGAKGGTPVGALVKAHYDDGRVIARRYGSVYNSASSQALRPLRFAVPAGHRIERLTVRWPGERDDQTYPAPPPNQLLHLDRP
jgi:hypothetical protein